MTIPDPFKQCVSRIVELEEEIRLSGTSKAGSLWLQDRQRALSDCYRSLLRLWPMIEGHGCPVETPEHDDIIDDPVIRKMKDKAFRDLIQNILSGEEDLMIAKQNGREVDQWMQDRIDDVRRSYQDLLQYWPIRDDGDSQVEPPPWPHGQ